MIDATKTSSPASGTFPAPPMLGVAALIVFTLLAVLIGRGGDVGQVALPAAEAVETVAFRAEDQADGSILLRKAEDHALITTIEPGRDGFMRGTLRGLAQARYRAGLGPEMPFLLNRYEDGRLALRDDATGRTVALEAFGRDNALAFARLLPSETKQP